MDLYEQVFYELIEIREMYAANAMLINCDPLVRMKTERTEKYIHLLNYYPQVFEDGVLVKEIIF